MNIEHRIQRDSVNLNKRDIWCWKKFAIHQKDIISIQLCESSNIKMYEAKGESSKKNDTNHIIMDDFNINSLTYD